MVVISSFADVVSGELKEVLENEKPIKFLVCGKPLKFDKVRVDIRHTPEAINDMTLTASITDKDVVAHLEPLLKKCGYQKEDVFASLLEEKAVKISWVPKEKPLELFKNQLLPFRSLEQLWKTQSAKGGKVFLNLDKAYQLYKIEVED